MKKLIIDWILTEELQPNDLNKWAEWDDEVKETNYNSIKERGILVPLIVKKDKTILDGHNRWKAARHLEIEKLPCVIAPDFENTSQEKAFIDIVQNARRHMTNSDWLKMIIDDYGEILNIDRRGKYRWNKSTGEEKVTNLAETISKRTGIPRSTVQSLIMKARKVKEYSLVRKGELPINYDVIEENMRLFQDYRKLEKKRSEIRREINAMKEKIEQIADFKHFKIYFDGGLRDKIKK